VRVSDPKMHGSDIILKSLQFELHVKSLVDIRKVPDMPPSTLKDAYLYQPYGLLPPVGEALMTHLFHHPDHADNESITCVWAPKKLRDQLKVCPRQGIGVGWGIHLVEGWLLNRLWSVALLVFLIGSLVFGTT
jgi:hypothetical protein